MRRIVELKEKNLLDILKVIQIHGPISKPDVAAKSNVSTVTAHSFIMELEKAGLVVSNGVAKSSGGRKAALYHINCDYGYIIGLNHGRTRLTTGLYDLSLNTVYVNRIRANLNKSFASIENMKKEIHAAIQNSGVPREKILGIGITLPGQVSHRDGVVISLLDLPEWDNTPLQSNMERHTGLPVCVYNDNRANIISCKWQNKIAESANAVYVNISDGVGAGVMIGGEVYTGSHSFAGELGHLAVPGRKMKCQCGSIGCIETLACSGHVIRQVQKKIGASALSGSSTRSLEDEIIKIAESNQDVRNIIHNAISHFPFILDAIIKAYDPEKIIIYNTWLLHFGELFNEMVETVFQQCKWLRKNSLAIELDTHDVHESYGPASVVLENLFNYNSENRIILRMD